MLPALKGLVFVDRLDAIQRKGVAANGITIENLPLLDAKSFQDSVAIYLGQPLTRRKLDEITRAVVLQYRANDRPLVDPIVPEQDISDGVVQIAVIEFRVGAVRAEGNTWFSSERLVAGIRAKPGEPVDGSEILGDIDTLNENPFRHVEIAYQRSVEPGRSDIILHTQDRLPLRVFASYDDAGVPSVGSNRVSAGFNWGDVFGLDHQLSYQATASDDLLFGNPSQTNRPDKPRFLAHSASYMVPLPWRDHVTIFGIYSESVPRLGNLFNQVGTSTQASIRYGVALARSERFTQGLNLGYDFKQSNNNLEFGGSQVSNGKTEIDQGVAEYTGTLRDSLGSTSATTALFLSPGNLTDNNTTLAFSNNGGGRAGAKAAYLYGQFGLDRLTALPWRLTWLAHGVMQRSDAPLLASEQFGIGGETTIRGYDQYAVQGDEGYLLTNELRSPPTSVGALFFDRPSQLDQLVLLGFVDLGHVSSRVAQSGQPNKATLASVGLGFRYNIDRYLDARFDYGWQLRHVPGPNAATTVGGSRGHLSIVVAW